MVSELDWTEGLSTIWLTVLCSFTSPFPHTILLSTQPFNSQVKFVILLTVNHTIIIMLVQRISY